MNEQLSTLILVGILIFGSFGLLSALSNNMNLNHIKSRRVGDGQHGTARFATSQELKRVYRHVPYMPKLWREGKQLPTEQGVILGGKFRGKRVTALVDSDDVHTIMIGAAGVGKTAFFLYPNLEYACASGMSWLCSDTKGDLYRNYAGIARDIYGYEIAVLDLRNPTRSDGNNLLHLVNKYMDLHKENPQELTYKAKAEKFAKITAKTIVHAGGDGDHGQNAYFYDAAEGLLTSVILLIAEFCEPEKRHIVSAFKLIQELLTPSKARGKNQFQLLIEKLPPEHKARWFAGAALNTGTEAMASVLSTAMSRLNQFLDSELEQILCFDTAIDAERFCSRKSAVFISLPEEDNTKYFMMSLVVQQLYREILAVADENGGKLQNRAMLFLDEIGTIPKIESLEMMFSAVRSRRVSIVAIIQSFAHLERNYGKEGSDIIIDNAQDLIFGGVAPNSSSAERLSKALGEQTVLSGSVSRGKNDPSQSLQMIGRPLMTPDELKSIPKGHFIVMKTGTHPMQSELRLFLDWGITLDEPFELQEKEARPIQYANKEELEQRIEQRYPSQKRPNTPLRRPVPIRLGGDEDVLF